MIKQKRPANVERNHFFWIGKKQLGTATQIIEIIRKETTSTETKTLVERRTELARPDLMRKQ